MSCDLGTKLVLGGGICGLSTAHYLLRKFSPSNVTVVEAAKRVGGWIRSTPHNDGYIFEQGPRTIRPKGEAGANTLQLIEDLNLTNEVRPVLSTNPAASNRMIYVNQNLYSLPSGFVDVVTQRPPFSKSILSCLLNDLSAPRKTLPDNDEDIYSFIERRLGTEVAKYAISPLICGICAGDAKEISVKFLMKSLFEGEQKYGSIIRGFLTNILLNRGSRFEIGALAKKAISEKWSIYSLNGGLETLPVTLYQNLVEKGAKVNLESNCSDIRFLEDHAVVTINDDKVIAEHVFSSLLSKNLAKIVEKQHPILAAELNSIPTVTVGVVNLQYNRQVIPHDAFGFLVPPSENLAILGVIFDSCCFPNGENSVLTVMMGGKWFEQHFGKDPAPVLLLDTALRNVKNILNIYDSPSSYEVNILKDCIPQYVVGHEERIKRIEGYINVNNLPLSLCGSSYYGVGVNDVILSAKKAVENFD